MANGTDFNLLWEYEVFYFKASTVQYSILLIYNHLKDLILNFMLIINIMLNNIKSHFS